MTNNISFKEEFFSLCEFLGVKLSTLKSYLGNYDGISKDKHRAFIWFKNSKSSFRIKNNRADNLSIPIADAHGRKYETQKEYYTLDGIILGMTKKEVAEIWGQPSGESNRAWSYENRGITTQRGKLIIIGVGFNEDANDELCVHEFFARLHDEQPSNSTFSILKLFNLKKIN